VNILIIDDTDDKVEALVELLASICPGDANSICRSYQSGVSALVNGQFDLVVLDMSMPTFELSPGDQGGRFRPFGGRDILLEIKRLNLRTKVIIVTQFGLFGGSSEKQVTLQQLKKDLDEQFHQNYLGAVHYDSTSAEWITPLKALIQKARD
jgi:CheY-like chemotaxis protein